MNRQILNWKWYKDINTKTVFIHCLLKANCSECEYNGQTIPRGSFATSVNTLSDETGLSTQQIRTALDHLLSTNEITIISNNRYSVITVVNYDMYEDDNNQNNNQVTEIEVYKNNKQNTALQKQAEEMFQRMWSRYPFKKCGKAAVRPATKKKLLTEVGEEQFIRCLERFKQDMGDRDPQYVVRGSTFFNTTYVDYLDENYQETMGIKANVTPQYNGQTRRVLQ